MRTASELEKIVESYCDDEIDKIIEMIGKTVDSDKVVIGFMVNHFIVLDSEIGEKINSLKQTFPKEDIYKKLNAQLKKFEWHLYCSNDVWCINKAFS